MWNHPEEEEEKKIVLKWLVIGRKNTSCSAKLEIEGE
jgi:hypothetical protein